MNVNKISLNKMELVFAIFQIVILVKPMVVKNAKIHSLKMVQVVHALKTSQLLMEAVSAQHVIALQVK